MDQSLFARPCGIVFEKRILPYQQSKPLKGMYKQTNKAEEIS